jgi:DNA-binding transcriptional LysR family regulator
MVTAKTQYKISAADMEIVLSMVRGGTLAEAGMRMGIDGSTVFRAIQRIEQGLGQRLFERSRKGYQPGDLAMRLAQHAERMEAELEEATNAAMMDSESVTGIVRITTTDTILQGLVLPVLKNLVLAHPLLQLELTASNELASLTKRDADIAVRATAQPPEHLIGRHLGPIRVAVFGPREKNNRWGKASALLKAPWIAPDDAMPEHPSVQWRRRQYPELVPRYKVNSISSVADAVANGLGIGVIPLFLAQARRDLVQLTEPIDNCETQLWLLTHTESRHLRRIATVFGHLAGALILR